MSFSRRLLGWYSVNKRDLPWRNSKNPYCIWLSEIILQQTRVQQGLDYYLKFLQYYPRVWDLAGASEEEVLKHWQGLGYYSRGRNLLKTARLVCENYNGIFPKDRTALMKLPGIGKYTAAAISSMAYNEPHLAVDGNVLRVMSRYLGMEIPVDTPQGQKNINEETLMLMDLKSAGDFNQALMDFGSLVCVPKNPDCEVCPFKNDCKAYQNDLQKILPIKSKKSAKKNRYMHYFIIGDKESVFINKRTNKGIWQNLYQFPVIETPDYQDPKSLAEALNKQGVNFGTILSISEIKKHILTHQYLHIHFWVVQANLKNIDLKFFNKQTNIVIPWLEIGNFAVPKIIDTFIQSELKPFYVR